MTEISRSRRYYAKALGIFYVAWAVSFEVVGRYAATLPTSDLTSNWDRAIPFVSAFVWPYEACYVLPFVALFVLKDWHRFNIALVAIAGSNLVAFAVYLALPVAFPRPSLGTGLSEQIVAMEYAADFSPGANKLPSMHVAISWIIACAMLGQRGRIADAATLGTVSAITLSTVFIKQHLVVDAVTGLMLGIGSFVLVRRTYLRRFGPHVTAEEALARMLRPWRRASVPAR